MDSVSKANHETQAALTKEHTFDYIAEALQTKSTSFHGGAVSKRLYMGTLKKAILALQELDKVKKALFYGVTIEMPSVASLELSCNNLNMQALSDSPHVGIDLIHGIIGKATEAGESLEALFAATIEGVPLDAVNVIEETGDGFWYDAITLAALQSNFGEAQTINIAKLRKRYPEKFTEYDATNRDLPAERKILEQKPVDTSKD